MFLLVLGAAVLLSPPSPRAEADGSELLARIGIRAVESSYRGRKMVIDFSRLTSQVTKLNIVYQLGGRERRDYLASRSVVVVDGDYFYQYQPDKKLVVKKKLPSEGGYEKLRQENLKQTLVSYELESTPSELIAGRKSHLYEFRPRHPGSRPLRKIWVDVETGLILRMEIYSPDNRLFWLSVFEELDYQPSVSPASFTMPTPSGVRVVESTEGECLPEEEAEATAGFALALPRYLPFGFVRKCIRARRSSGHGEVQVVYSDGLSLLSLFESSRPGSPGGGAPAGAREVSVGKHEGSLQRAGLVSALSWNASQAHMTILGEVSHEELLRIAGSITPFRELSQP